jgi:sugar-specific transcriptional regulator TrmB
MTKDLTHIFTSLGFDEKEAQLYLAGLTLGAAPASEYATCTGIHRITSYNLLEELVTRGYFTVVRKLRAKFYAPVSPEYMALEARKNAESIENALPALKLLQSSHYCPPKVQYFEGIDGIRSVYQDILTSKTEILTFANVAVNRSVWPEYDEYIQERILAGISLRGIYPDHADEKSTHGADAEKFQEIRCVPAADFDFQSDITLYDHKVAICSFLAGSKFEKDLFGIIIEGKEVTETHRQIFEMAWRYAETKNSSTAPKKSMFKRTMIA